MDHRVLDRYSARGLPGAPTRRSLIAGAAGLLVAAGLFGEDAAARRVRNRRRNRNHNRSKETSVSIPGEPGEPGQDGEP